MQKEEVEKYYNSIAESEGIVKKNSFTKDVLISQTFVLWYVLTEGIKSNDYGEIELQEMLNRNKSFFITEFKSDADCNFIFGWMLNISFWYFKINDDNEGNKYLYKAYKADPRNVLFKWAIRNFLNLSDSEVSKMENILKNDFDKYYPYDGNIKDYFRGLWK